MLCEHCRMREATVKYVEVINGVKSEHNLCAQCASRLDIGQYSAIFEGEFPLRKLLSGLLGVEDTEETEGRYAGVVCPSCGTTYEEFVKNSRFGCPDCYSVFDPLISENIKHLQGSERHVGKRPKKPACPDGAVRDGDSSGDSGTCRVSPDEQIRILQARLREAVRREEYEEAAALRDQIHKIKEETEQDGEMV